MDIESLDLIKLFRIIKQRFWLICLSFIICFTFAFTYTTFFVVKQYSADVLLYIWQDKNPSVNSSSSSNYSDMMLFAQLVNDYQVLSKSRLVTSTVASELGMDAEQSGRLSSQITVGTKNNTRHLTITVTDPDPARAAMIANKVSTVFAAVVVENMGAGTVNIIDPAIVPTQASSPNVKLNLMLGALIGLLFGIGLALIIEMLDTRVKTSQDVESITGFSPLGGIPEFDLAVLSAREGRQ